MKIREKIYFKVSATSDILFSKSFVISSYNKLGLKNEVKYNLEKEELSHSQKLNNRNAKIIGVNYLHNHPRMEMDILRTDKSHVIIDRDEWEEVLKYFQNTPSRFKELTDLAKGGFLSLH